MRYRPHVYGALVVACVLLLLGFGRASAAAASEVEAAEAYRERALRVQSFTYRRLAYPRGPERCPAGTTLSFSRALGAPESDAWYVGSQLMADVALARIDGPGTECAIRKAVAFLDLLRKEGGAGGYWPRANVDGSGVTRRDIFADDNALLGLALLELRSGSEDPAWRDLLLRRATRAARFLTDEEYWDQIFGGGFWWASGRGALREGKPAQTTALAGLLFARLYEETGQARWSEWALRCLKWLDDRLVHPERKVYLYGIRHSDLNQRSGEVVDPHIFSYDQGIMIELHLVLHRAVDPKAGHLERARDLAARLRPNFWDPKIGGYRLNAFIPEVYATYGAWVSASLLALYEVDGDATWLEEARANLDVLERYLADPSDGGYAQLYSSCEIPQAWGCQEGAPSARDPTKLLSSQAWMQRAQALLAAALVQSPAGPR